MANKIAHPKWRKVWGWCLIVIGVIILLTPFTPGSILLLVGTHMVYGDRIKWLNNIETKVKRLFNFETTRVGKFVYDVALIKSFAQNLPIQEVDVEKFRELVGENHIYWIDKDGNELGPYQILKDWETAQKNPAWAYHIDRIKRADLSNPIWSTKEGIVFDGMHRLTRAFIDKIPTIKVRVFESLPEEAIVK